MSNRAIDLEDRLVDFAVRVIGVVEALPETKAERHIAGQLVRAGTSPAANYGEAQSAESKNDFIHKMKVCLKELRETLIWLKMIQKKPLCPPERLGSILTECDELAALNGDYAARHPEQRDLAARMETYELAYRMQMEVPEVLDIADETQSSRDLYGLDDKDTAVFGRQCLLARRMVEQGVRFVQIFSGGWDSHDYLERAHTERIRSVDKPMAGLIRDLKQRGMLNDTLVIWTGEFGRTPDNNKRGGVYSLGRGHNAKAMTMLLAGGGVKPGIVGATDELGSSAIECVQPIRNLHVTLLHLLGLDDNKLTYLHAGRYKQLSQFGGEVIQDVIA